VIELLVDFLVTVFIHLECYAVVVNNLGRVISRLLLLQDSIIILLNLSVHMCLLIEVL
jgi:hypothetical protein